MPESRSEEKDKVFIGDKAVKNLIKHHNELWTQLIKLISEIDPKLLIESAKNRPIDIASGIIIKGDYKILKMKIEDVAAKDSTHANLTSKLTVEFVHATDFIKQGSIKIPLEFKPKKGVFGKAQILENRNFTLRTMQKRQLSPEIPNRLKILDSQFQAYFEKNKDLGKTILDSFGVFVRDLPILEMTLNYFELSSNITDKDTKWLKMERLIVMLTDVDNRSLTQHERSILDVRLFQSLAYLVNKLLTFNSSEDKNSTKNYYYTYAILEYFKFMLEYSILDCLYYENQDFDYSIFSLPDKPDLARATQIDYILYLSDTLGKIGWKVNNLKNEEAQKLSIKSFDLEIKIFRTFLTSFLDSGMQDKLAQVTEILKQELLYPFNQPNSYQPTIYQDSTKDEISLTKNPRAYLTSQVKSRLGISLNIRSCNDTLIIQKWQQFSDFIDILAESSCNIEKLIRNNGINDSLNKQKNLKIEKLRSSLAGYYSFRLNNNDRVIFGLNQECLTLYSVGGHQYRV